MIKRCIGCGTKLQQTNSNEPGYTPKTDAKYCMRCFKMTNYGQIKPEKVNKNNQDVINLMNKSTSTVFFLTDILNINAETMQTFQRITTPKILVISKSDIIPNEISGDKLIKSLQETYHVTTDIIALSAKKHVYTKSILKYMENNNIKKAYLAGYTNCGKSTLINEITRKNDITTSSSVNTTLDFINIPIGSLTLMDTPGFNYQEPLYNETNLNLVKKINPSTMIKPKSYQTKENQVFIIEGLLEFQNFGQNKVIFYISNDLDLKKKYASTTETYPLSIKDNTDIVIKGMGFINVKKACTVMINKNAKPYIETRNSILGGCHE